MKWDAGYFARAKDDDQKQMFLSFDSEGTKHKGMKTFGFSTQEVIKRERKPPN